MKNLTIGNLTIGPNAPLAILAGPCVIESEEHAMFCAAALRKILKRFPFSFIFKASYDKANRSSIESFRGPGLDKGLRILEKIKQEFDLPILTDVHSPEEAQAAAALCDMIQIPAFLCRQTDLIAAAGRTKAAVNVKKGQFMAPWDMKNVVDKLLSCGQDRILLTDRGTSFGYNNLVSDFRSIPIMQKLGFPVCFDATHSVQLPGGMGHASGGQREFIPVLAKAAVAVGSNALFLECHPDPASALSDAASVLPFDALTALLEEIERIYNAVQPAAGRVQTCSAER
ncbi:MAG: kdsA [Parachlamydiales bacterium]|nr:kdsA [Parachlamydiales bacterium]